MSILTKKTTSIFDSFIRKLDLNLFMKVNTLQLLIAWHQYVSSVHFYHLAPMLPWNSHLLDFESKPHHLLLKCSPSYNLSRNVSKGRRVDVYLLFDPFEMSSLEIGWNLSLIYPLYLHLNLVIWHLFDMRAI